MPKCKDCEKLYEPHEARAHRFCVLDFGGAYTKILANWPQPLRESFEAYAKKFWSVQSQHYQYADNYRVARANNLAEVTIYEIAMEAGCCGSQERTIELDGVQIMFGFNYGH